MLVSTAALGVACAPAPSPMGDRCGELVAFYLSVPQVETHLGEEDATTATVRIDWRTGEREGVALCRFESAGAPLAIAAAFVDENRLDDEQIAAFNHR